MEITKKITESKFAKSVIKSKKTVFNGYKKSFHNKWFAPFIYAALAVAFLVIVIFLNVYFMADGKYTLKQSFHVLTHWKDVEWKNSAGTPVFGGDAGATAEAIKELHKQWFNIAATLLGGLGMTLAAVVTQSLTRNPIAEGSTLGLVQAAIFGLLFALSLGASTLVFKYLYMTIFAFAGAGLLTLFIIFGKKNGSGAQKIILAGLAIGIIFKTLSFIFKGGDQNANAVSYAYVLGGAESISGEPLALEYNKFDITILISSILIFVGLVLTTINIKGMNLLEIGDERAKNLGSSILRTRIINVFVVVLVLPATVLVVGNMAFLGLFTVNATRWLMRSRNYKKVLPISLIVGMLMASLGYQLTEHIPSINSGLWMTFIGAPYLIYIGIRGLK